MGDEEAAGVSRAHSPTTCLKYSGIHARRMKYPQLLTKLAKMHAHVGALDSKSRNGTFARSFPFAIAASPGELSTTAPPPSISASSLGLTRAHLAGKAVAADAHAAAQSTPAEPKTRKGPDTPPHASMAGAASNPTMEPL